jgi:hypothetical protein
MAMAIAPCIQPHVLYVSAPFTSSSPAGHHTTAAHYASPLRVLGCSLALEVVTTQGLVWCPAGPADKQNAPGLLGWW